MRDLEAHPAFPGCQATPALRVVQERRADLACLAYQATLAPPAIQGIRELRVPPAIRAGQV